MDARAAVLALAFATLGCNESKTPTSPTVGEYEATLTFKKKGDATVHTVTFPFKIGDRKQLEIP